jgi:hypothetical protein
VGFVVDKVVLRYIFLRVLPFPLSLLFRNFAKLFSLIYHRRYEFLPIDSVVQQNRQHIPTNIICYGQPLHIQVPDKESCSKSHLTPRLLLKCLNCRCCYDILPFKILIHIFLPWRNSPHWAKAFSLSRIYDHLQSVGLLWASDHPDADTFT